MSLDKKIAGKVNPLPQTARNPNPGKIQDVGSLPSTRKSGGRASMGTGMPSTGKKSM